LADNVAVTAGSGTTIAADEVIDGTLGTVKVQYVKLMDGTLDGSTKATVGAGGLKVDPTSSVAMNTGTRSATTQRVTVATDDVVPVSGSLTTVSTVTNLSQMGGVAIALNTGVRSTGTQRVTIATDDLVPVNNSQVGGTAVATGSGVMNSGTQRIALATDSPGIIGTAALTAATAPSTAIATLGQYNATLPSPTDGQTVAVQLDSKGRNRVSGLNGLANLAFSAAFSTLTRQANTTAYTALDSISDNATAASVTALSATLADVNDDPLFISEILVTSTDTGLAGKRIRAYLYNSDPTASSGVVGGDNLAFSNKKAGYIGSFSGLLETGFSDGTVGRLVPSYADGAAAGTPHASANGFIVTKPTSGAKTLFIQYQAVDGFTPSANSTTIIGTARGWQARAV
jgi:hypothetical protein